MNWFLNLLIISIPNKIYTKINRFSATRRCKCHQNKVKVKGLGRSSSYLAGFSIFFHDSMKKLNQLANKKNIWNLSLT